MIKEYSFCYLGGPSDGRTDQRHLSREVLVDFLKRVTKEGPKPKHRAGEEPRYELVDFKGGTFYFEWLNPE